MTISGNPFDDEFERFVGAVRGLLVPLLEDAQRFGLKARHLGKHKRRIDRFYRDMVTGQHSLRDMTARYRKRFERYKESLFSFIESDGVPWHNNAAERALRHLAVQRKISGSFSEKGGSDYLRLLAIAQNLPIPAKIVSRLPSVGILQTWMNTETGAECILIGRPTVRTVNDVGFARYNTSISG